MTAAGLDDVDWFAWRLLTKPEITRASIKEILTTYTLADMARGHLAIDLAELLEPDPPEPPKTKAGR